jgi:predicted RNA-binding protein with PIN domain
VRWLIDGYNVIRRHPELRAREAVSLEAGRTALLRLVARVSRDSVDQVVVVFDGARAVRAESVAAAAAKVQVMFSRPPEKADDVLMRLAAQWRDGAIVISSDRAVHAAARRAGSTALSADEFLTALESPGDETDEDRGEGDGDEEAARLPKRGTAHRLSKDARAAQRALRRLRGGG